MSKYDDAIIEIAKEYSWVNPDNVKVKRDRDRWYIDLGQVVNIMNIAKSKGYLNSELLNEVKHD